MTIRGETRGVLLKGIFHKKRGSNEGGESREGMGWISLPSSWRMATGMVFGVVLVPWFKRQLHQCLILSSTLGQTLGGTWGGDTEPREPSGVLPTFCNRREPEYLVTMEYSSPPKASAQDFTLKKGPKEGKSMLVIPGYIFRQVKLNFPKHNPLHLSKPLLHRDSALSPDCSQTSREAGDSAALGHSPRTLVSPAGPSH